MPYFALHHSTSEILILRRKDCCLGCINFQLKIMPYFALHHSTSKILILRRIYKIRKLIFVFNNVFNLHKAWFRYFLRMRYEFWPRKIRISGPSGQLMRKNSPSWRQNLHRIRMAGSFEPGLRRHLSGTRVYGLFYQGSGSIQVKSTMISILVSRDQFHSAAKHTKLLNMKFHPWYK